MAKLKHTNIQGNQLVYNREKTKDVRVVMQTALVSNATAIVLAHNHPSGNTRPSGQDDSLTRKIKSACELMDIRVLDHIIVTPYDSHYSYNDEGRL